MVLVECWPTTVLGAVERLPMTERLLLTELSADAALYAEADALWLRYEGVQPDLSLARRRDWERLGELTAFGKELSLYVEQLIESELAEAEVVKFEGSEAAGPHVRVDYFDLDRIDQDYDFFKRLAPPAPFYLMVEGEGAIGTSDFRYHYRYHLGPTRVYPHRFGCFLKYTRKIFRMDQNLFRLVTTLDDFNQRHQETTDPAALKAESLKTHHEIQALAEEVGARLDSYLRQEKVICADKVHLGVSTDPQGRITFYPIFPATSEAESLQAFLTSGSVPTVYDIIKPDGSRDRVIVDEPVKEILEKMLRVRHVSGRTKAQALGDPFSVLEGADLEVIDLEGYGPRVRAIGDYPKEVRAYVRKRSMGFLDEDAPTEIGIEVVYPTGEREEVKFGSVKEAQDLYDQTGRARERGEPTVPWQGKELPVTKELEGSLEECLSVVKATPGTGKGKVPRPGRYLIIYTNEPELEYTIREGTGEIAPATPSLPDSLESPEILKPHQSEGLGWFQRLFGSSKRGALLADEMGLGKTLQVLTFMAWYLENHPEPKKPLLAVMPLMLLENEVWLKEIASFFHAQGDIFTPWLVLHGQTLNRCKEIHADGQEIHLGEPVLRWRELARNRLILTNYHTVVNYQFSLGKIDWGLVIADEGQYFKEPKTLVSRAIKALNADFRITLTGTPVENSLMDLWNLMDFLHPGLLLSAREFAQQYMRETSEDKQDVDTSQQKIVNLREKLGVGHPEGFILRRSKDTLVGLPPKLETVIKSDLSEEQRRQHLQLISQARLAKASSPGAHLKILHELVKLYQHPCLTISHKGPMPSSTELVEDCPKLRSVLKKLKEIRSLKEKVLIFTRYRYMQAILQTVIENEFGITVNIINGSSAPKTGRIKSNRQALLNDFQQQDGFQVIILSPQVAGLGLNIVEANNVIHYGRWWNPALEDQATDRVYRIGQKREVHVYYPVSTDPLKQFISFDEKLGELLGQKKQLRHDFLAPIKEEDSLASELYEGLVSDDAGNNQATPTRITPEEIATLPFDEFEGLVATLLAAMDFKVILTPLGSDGGIDVVGLGKEFLYMVECKHLTGPGAIGLDAVNQVINGYEYYRTRLLPPQLLQLPVRLLVVTNASFDNQASQLARECEVELWGFNILRSKLDRYHISTLNINLIQNDRCLNLVDVKDRFNKT